MKKNEIKVSVIVPVYNVSPYLHECMDSIINQTLKDIEVICVDDGSTDDSLSILNQYAKKDKRIKVIHFDENQSSNIARKRAVLESSGEYIIFCDSDDTLNVNMCEILYLQMLETHVDILNFGVKIINFNASEEGEKWLQNNVNPYIGNLTGKDIFVGTFEKKLFAKNLWDKMFSSKVAKKSFALLEDKKIYRGQDLYIFFILAFFAESYRGITKPDLYEYRYGRGIEGKKTLNKKHFEKYKSYTEVTDCIRNFLIEQNAYDDYEKHYTSIEQNLFDLSINIWKNKVVEQDKSACFDILLTMWNSDRVIGKIAHIFQHERSNLVSMVKNSDIFNITCQSPKVIGMYYHSLKGGGVQRVIEFLSKLYLSMGYKIVLIIDWQGTSSIDLECLSNVTVYRVTYTGNESMSNFHIRAKELKGIIRNEKIDVMIYHAWVNSFLVWDMLLFKANNVPFVIHTHNIFTIPYSFSTKLFSDNSVIYKFADAVITLSPVDTCYWKKFNSNVYETVNPNTLNVKGITPCKLDTKTIVWIGRFSKEKNPEEALYIFSIVLKTISDAKLIVVGDGLSPEYMIKMKDLADLLSLGESVELVGFQDDVSAYLHQASVFLNTSDYEGFSLVMLESKSFGIPIVLYELPYLTLSRKGTGVFPVRFGDADAAAEQIVRLLQDSELRNLTGVAARKHALELSEYNYEQLWSNVLDSLKYNHKDLSVQEDELVMWETLFNSMLFKMVKENVSKTRQKQVKTIELEKNKKELLSKTVKVSDINELAKLEDKLVSARLESNLIRKSASYKIGRFMTIIPRSLRCLKENGVKYTIGRLLFRVGWKYNCKKEEL